MPEDLFFELLQSEEETRARCFKKFPQRTNPVGLLPPVGALMDYECKSSQPCTPLWQRRLPESFQFNEGLATGEFELTPRQRKALEEWQANIAQGVEWLQEGAVLATHIFPKLKGYRPGQAHTEVDRALRLIASNINAMRRAYRAWAPQGFPRVEIVGRSWAVFRFIQVHLTAHVEYLAQYGVDVHSANQESLENERTDLNYLVHAVLAGGLASKDGAMRWRFRALYPKGLLIPEETQS